VADYKYGYRPHDPFEHLQMCIYVAAGLDYLKQNGQDEQTWEVEIVVCQPRAFGLDPIRRWNTKGALLRPIWNKLADAAAAVVSADPRLMVGPYCEDCSARWACPALQTASLTAMDVSARLIPHDITPAAMGDALRRLVRHQENINALVSGMRDQLEHAIRNGHTDQHWELGHGRSKLAWKEGCESQVLALADMLGTPVAKPRKAITPLQAEKLLDPEIVARFIERRPGARKLIPFNIRKYLP
jgi:hypothetical protein